MQKMPIVVVVGVVLGLIGQEGPAAEIEASPPKSVGMAIYDTGFALVNELRSTPLDKGENRVLFRQFPSRLDPATVAFSFVAGGASVEVLEQQFQYDLSDIGRMLDRYIGKPVEIVTGPVSCKGVLLHAASTGAPLAIQGDNGAVSYFANSESLTDIVFPNAAQMAQLGPTLSCTMNAAQDSLQNLRVTYVTEGMRWDASYDAILQGGGVCLLVARVNVYNGCGGRFENARVKLVSTEKGRVQPATPNVDLPEGFPALRYSYGREEAEVERTVASGGVLSAYELPRPLTMELGAELHVQLGMGSRVPVTKFYVYDGVRFDRFQRNRRNDWNYGTEYHSTVETHLQFGNTKEAGLGIDLPPGRFRLYQQKADSSLDLMGEDFLQATPAGATATVLLGPARGIQGERERTGYSEVTPLHEYEESFEIRLSNDSTEEIEVRVVEHLYRWNQFEIVKADTDYTTTGPQTIEFRPVLKPGGKRTVHYTVRYRW